MNYSPIALFVYNRLEHTRKTVEALQKNKHASESSLFVFADAAKNNSGHSAVSDVRSYIKTITGFERVTIIERDENFGLAKSITEGVTELVNQYGKVIVLEDDIVTSPFFLEFMNKSLELYKDDTQVASIHGYIYPIKEALPETFFIKGADCWGWATWKRAWEHFNGDAKSLLEKIKDQNLEKEFNFDNSFHYVKMLQRRAEGKNNAWAVCWYASAFLENMFTLYPGRSLVQNIGNDMSGTHAGSTNVFETTLSDKPISIHKLPMGENKEVRGMIKKFFRRIKPGFLRRLNEKLKKNFQ